MPINTELHRASVTELLLDPKNPRLGRAFVASKPSQSAVRQEIEDNALEEIIVSVIDSGFWPQEALLVVKESVKKNGKKELVVVEGNRRLAALKIIADYCTGVDLPPKWQKLFADTDPDDLSWVFSEIPYMLADDRKDVLAYLGFRHVTGIKQWKPPEKAEFIASLIDEHGLTFREVMRQIGSKTATVKQHYMAYKLLRQMDSYDDSIDIKRVEKRFSLLYLSLRSIGTRNFLHIDIDADPSVKLKPVPKKHIANLIDYAKWLFGFENIEPVFPDSRQIDLFGDMLESDAAVEYLRRNPKPKFERALMLSGGESKEIARHIGIAVDELEEVLGTIHLKSIREDHYVKLSVARLFEHVFELKEHFSAAWLDLQGDS